MGSLRSRGSDKLFLVKNWDGSSDLFRSLPSLDHARLLPGTVGSSDVGSFRTF